MCQLNIWNKQGIKWVDSIQRSITFISHYSSSGEYFCQPKYSGFSTQMLAQFALKSDSSQRPVVNIVDLLFRFSSFMSDLLPFTSSERSAWCSPSLSFHSAPSVRTGERKKETKITSNCNQAPHCSASVRKVSWLGSSLCTHSTRFI